MEFKLRKIRTTNPFMKEITIIDQLENRIEKLESVCGEAYQLAGCCGAPVEALDNLSDAASGRPIRHKTFLPICPDEDLEEVRESKGKLNKAETLLNKIRKIDLGSGYALGSILVEYLNEIDRYFYTEE